MKNIIDSFSDFDAAYAETFTWSLARTDKPRGWVIYHPISNDYETFKTKREAVAAFEQLKDGRFPNVSERIFDRYQIYLDCYKGQWPLPFLDWIEG